MAAGSETKQVSGAKGHTAQPQRALEAGTYPSGHRAIDARRFRDRQGRRIARFVNYTLPILSESIMANQ